MGIKMSCHCDGCARREKMTHNTRLPGEWDVFEGYIYCPTCIKVIKASPLFAEMVRYGVEHDAETWFDRSTVCISFGADEAHVCVSFRPHGERRYSVEVFQDAPVAHLRAAADAIEHFESILKGAEDGEN